MAFVNVGAKTREGRRFKTKAALRRALDDAPSEVLFDITELRDAPPEDICGDSIPTGMRLVVVGPDPYNRRVWYANVAQHGGKPVLR